MKKTPLIIAFLLALVALVAVNVLSTLTLKGVRADLTEAKLYTLTTGTENILSSLEEPVTFDFYFSRKVSQAQATAIITYATRIQELLEEYEAKSNGNVKLNVIDPIPFSEVEVEAAGEGLEAIPVNAQGDRIFLGLVAKNSVDGKEIIPFFDPTREAYLEYDLSKIVYNLNKGRKPVLGVITELPITGEQDPIARVSNPQAPQPWAIYQQLTELYTVRKLTGLQPIEQDVDLLMIIHPRDLPEVVQYNVEQFILAGKNAFIYVDPHAEIEQVPQDPQNPMAAMFASKASQLGLWSNMLGVSMSAENFLADSDNAITSQYRDDKGIVNTGKFLHYISFGPENFAEDVVTDSLQQKMIFVAAGALQINEDAQTKITPLVFTSPNTDLMNIDDIKISPNPDVMQKNFESAGKVENLAVRIEGNAKSAFPGGLDASANANHLDESPEGINVIVVADVDTLADRLWIQRQRMFGQEIAIPFGSNGNFALNVLENLSGNNDLISIRSRGVSERPFKVLEDLAKAASEKFQQREQELQDRIDEIQQEINELTQSSNDGQLSLTTELRSRINEAREESIKAGSELREVRRNLDQDQENLKSRLLAYNVLLVPALVIAFALIMSIVQLQRRKRTA